MTWLHQCMFVCIWLLCWDGQFDFPLDWFDIFEGLMCQARRGFTIATVWFETWIVTEKSYFCVDIRATPPLFQPPIWRRYDSKHFSQASCADHQWLTSPKLRAQGPVSGVGQFGWPDFFWKPPNNIKLLINANINKTLPHRSFLKSWFVCVRLFWYNSINTRVGPYFSLGFFCLQGHCQILYKPFHFWYPSNQTISKFFSEIYLSAAATLFLRWDQGERGTSC